MDSDDGKDLSASADCWGLSLFGDTELASGKLLHPGIPPLSTHPMTYVSQYMKAAVALGKKCHF